MCITSGPAFTGCFSSSLPITFFCFIECLAIFVSEWHRAEALDHILPEVSPPLLPNYQSNYQCFILILSRLSFTTAWLGCVCFSFAFTSRARTFYVHTKCLESSPKSHHWIWTHSPTSYPCIVEALGYLLSSQPSKECSLLLLVLIF